MRAWLLVALLLAGCVGAPPDAPENEPPAAATSCGHSLTFRDEGLYDALANASVGEFTHENWAAPGLPYDNATLAARWRDFSLLAVTRTFAAHPEVPTSVSVRARPDGSYEIVGSAEANVSDGEMREAFLAFARDTIDAPEAALVSAADRFVASRAPSAWRDGTPGNAAPEGTNGTSDGLPPREYAPGPVYGYSFDVTPREPLRVQALLDGMPPLDRWSRVDAERGRMLYERDGWALWFEQPTDRLRVGDVRIAAVPTGEADVAHLARAGPEEAAARIREAFLAAGLAPPEALRPASLAPMGCGH